jgi:hypothetical protein
VLPTEVGYPFHQHPIAKALMEENPTTIAGEGSQVSSLPSIPPLY